MSRFQIRDKDFGVAIEEADSARDALYRFFAARVKGELRPLIAVGADGSATVTYDGETYTAVPAEASS